MSVSNLAVVFAPSLLRRGNFQVRRSKFPGLTKDIKCLSAKLKLFKYFVCLLWVFKEADNDEILHQRLTFEIWLGASTAYKTSKWRTERWTIFERSCEYVYYACGSHLYGFTSTRRWWDFCNTCAFLLQMNLYFQMLVVFFIARVEDKYCVIYWLWIKKIKKYTIFMNLQNIMRSFILHTDVHREYLHFIACPTIS